MVYLNFFTDHRRGGERVELTTPPSPCPTAMTETKRLTVCPTFYLFVELSVVRVPDKHWVDPGTVFWDRQKGTTKESPKGARQGFINVVPEKT